MKSENHAELNAKGWSATITALVAAMECDFDRLEELRDELQALDDDCADAECDPVLTARNRADWLKENEEEFKDLTDAATVDGDLMESADAVRERIQQSPLSVQVRSGWANPGDEMVAEDFEILLSTGGPALRIMGELDEHKQPHRAWLEYQDWGTPWTAFHGEGAASQADLVAFASCFYFGE